MIFGKDNPNLVRAAPPIRPDMIFGKDSGKLDDCIQIRGRYRARVLLCCRMAQPSCSVRRASPAVDIPWIDGRLPVTIDTLFGQVKLGITHSATALNPVFMKRAMFGRRPSLSARSIYAGSPPSLQTTTTGRSGQLYRTPLRRISAAETDVIAAT